MTKKHGELLRKSEADRECYEIERRRLIDGTPDGEPLIGFYSASFYVHCNGNAAAVLARAKEALLMTTTQFAEGRELSLDAWREVLPDWFLGGMAPDYTAEDLAWFDANWDTASRAEKDAYLARFAPCTLVDWINVVEPCERWWFWWDVTVKNPNTLLVHIDEIGNDPPDGFPGGAQCLFKLSGSIDHDFVEDPEDWTK